jgi:hypothetical protein
VRLILIAAPGRETKARPQERITVMYILLYAYPFIPVITIPSTI